MFKLPFVLRKTHEKALDNAEQDLSEVFKRFEEYMYFAKKGQEAARMALNGYVMVDKKFLPKGKNCPIFMGHGLQNAANNLGVFSKKWKRDYDHEMRQKLKRYFNPTTNM